MKLRFVPILLVFFTMTPILIPTCQGQQAQPAWLMHPEMHTKWKAWQETMKHTALPTTNGGCFQGSYPSVAWQETPCSAPSSKHYSAQATGNSSQIIGKTSDYVAEVSGDPLSSASGSFPIVSGYTPPPSGQFSLQLNSNFFITPVCNGASIPSQCSGWVQFVFDNSAPVLEIEYSVVNWGSASCPSGFSNRYTVPGTSDEIVCDVNTPTISVAEQPYANLPYLELTAEVSGSTNTAILTTADGNIYATQQTGLFGTTFASNWTAAEFNVFGDNSGNEVSFNSGTTFVVRTEVNNGSTAAPSCSDQSYTGESNNLSLVGTCCSLRRRIAEYSVHGEQQPRRNEDARS